MADGVIMRSRIINTPFNSTISIWRPVQAVRRCNLVERSGNGIECDAAVRMSRMRTIVNKTADYTVVRSLNEILRADVDSMLGFASRRNLLHSVVIGIWREGEAFVWTHGEGVAHDSSLEIGSVTKTFTAELVDLQVKRGKLSWSDSFALHLPENLKRRKEIQKAAKDISLLDLATHRAGLPLLPKNIKFTDAANPYGTYGLRDIEEYLEGEFLAKPAQKRYNYSNISFAVLGYILQEVTQTSYRDLLQEDILTPLDLDHTGLALTGDHLKPVVQGYSETGLPTARWTQLAFSPTGGLYSTAGDQLKWIRYLLREDNRSILRPHLAHKNQYVGLGWEYDPMLRVFKRDGMTGGFCSYLSVSTDHLTGIALLSNRKSIEIVRAIATNLERALQGVPLRPLRGNYGSARAHLIEKARNNKLTYYLARKARRLFQST